MYKIKIRIGILLWFDLIDSIAKNGSDILPFINNYPSLIMPFLLNQSDILIATEQYLAEFQLYGSVKPFKWP